MSQPNKWHEIHARRIRTRESTHKERLQRYKLGHSLKYRVTITIPKIMSLNKNYRETAEIFRAIHHHVFKEGRSIALDFSQCEQLTAESCVVLAAEIDRCLRKKPKSVTGNYPTNEEVYLNLKTLGFFQLLNIKADQTGVNYEVDPDAEIVPLVSGAGKREELLNGIIELFSNLPVYKEMGQKFDYDVFRALTEGMLNTIEHAYPNEYKKNKDCVGRWWRAAFKTSNNITLVLYDQGVGIPNTLPTTWNETLIALLSGKLDPSDGLMIKLATEVGRTSADQKEKGKGLKDIKHLIDVIGAGALKIHSYKGHYIYRPNSEELYKDEEIPIHGTLILWIADISEKEKHVAATVVGVLLSALIGSIGFLIIKFLDGCKIHKTSVKALTEDIVSQANANYAAPNQGNVVNIITKANELGALISKKTRKNHAVSSAWTEFRSFVSIEDVPPAPAATFHNNCELARRKADDFLRSLKIT